MRILGVRLSWLGAFGIMAWGTLEHGVPRRADPSLYPTRSLWYPPNMAAKPVQVSMDTALLRRIDADPEVRRSGRSALIRSAVELYLAAKERQEIESRLEGAYAGEADALLAEIEELMGDQAWPSE